MCKCTPEIKTPFCGKGDCQWPTPGVERVKYYVVIFKWLNDNHNGYGVMEILAKCKDEEEAYNAYINFPGSFIVKEARLSREYREI